MFLPNLYQRFYVVYQRRLSKDVCFKQETKLQNSRRQVLKSYHLHFLPSTSKIRYIVFDVRTFDYLIGSKIALGMDETHTKEDEPVA